MNDLAEAQQEAAVARERERLERRRAEHLARGNEALQATIDALSELTSADELIPKVLEIVAHTFQTTSCAFFRNDLEGTIWLVYWYSEGKAYIPSELFELDPEQFGLIRCLAQGFVSPDSYLGGPTAEVLGPVLIDHEIGTSGPEFDAFCLRMGWELELNIGVAVRGIRASTLCIYRDHSRPFTEDEVILGEALAKQLGVAYQNIRLAEEAKLTAIAKERELAAERRASELARGNDALQSTIDALSEAKDTDEVIPKVLQIVAKTFQVEDCAFFENEPSGLVRLLYWHTGGRSLLPAELLNLDSARFGLVKHLAEGFFVPTSYLGGIAQDVIGSVIIDHVVGTSVPEYDAFAVASGWELELNIGVAAGGCRACSLCIFRDRSRPFGKEEIVLGEALAKQLGVAYQTSRLSKEAKLSAIVQEKAKLAVEKSKALEGINHAVQKSVDRLTHAENTRAAITEILIAAGELMQPYGAYDLGLMEFDPGLRSIRCSILVSEGVEIDLANTPLDHSWPVDSTPMFGPWERIRSEDFIWGLTSDQTVLVPDVRGYHESRGAKAIAYVPTRRGRETTGFIGFALRSDEPLGADLIGLLRTLAGHVSLAVELDRVAGLAKEVDLSKERELTALKQVRELARAQAYLADTGSKLRSLSDLDNYLLDLVHSASQILGAIGGAFGMVDEASKTLVIKDRFPCPNNPSEYQSQEFVFPLEGPSNLRWDSIRSVSNYWWADVYDDRFSDGFRDYHIAEGRLYFAHFPIRFMGKAEGFLGFAFPENTPPPNTSIELVQLLAEHASTSIQMTRWAEAARKATLEKANEARSAAVIEERYRIAREMHDGITQVLAGIVIQVGEASEDLSVDIGSSRDRLGKIEGLARKGLEESRILLRTLRGEGAEVGFAEGLAKTIQDIAQEGGLQANVSLNSITVSLTPAERFTIVRICQEAVLNVVKHAAATALTVIWTENRTAWSLMIADNGKGLTDTVARGHFGIVGMKERAAEIGATLSILGRPGEGTRITLSRPLATHAMNRLAENVAARADGKID